MNSIGPLVQTVSPDIFGSKRRHAAAVLGGLIALKLALLFALAWNTLFVMDEFAQLGWAKYFGNGLFETLWPAKAVGYAVFYQLAHLVGWDAPSILLAGRLQTAILACGTLGLIYASARALGEDKLRALLIILVLLCFSNFMERIFRTRAEPLSVFFAAAALLVVLRGQADRARTLILAGLFSGLAFLATQKALYFNLALGIALVADAALARRYAAGVIRGALLVLGWLAPIAAYCLIFGGTAPLPVAQNLVFGPVEVATQGAAPYGGLRYYVLQTLARNAILYALCFAGMALALGRLRSLDERRRIALVFSVVIAALIFTHDQPWPYVFVMALPFISLWGLWVLDRVADNGRAAKMIWLAVGVAVAASFVKNITYLQLDNRAQLAVVTRAEALVGPDERYFDGVAMLPNRQEPSALWLDRVQILATLRERENSEAYRVFARTPPKLIIWSKRMDDISPVVGPLIERRYVQVAPNIRMLGRRLPLGEATRFDVPRAGRYALYSETGERLSGLAQVDGGAARGGPFELASGTREIILRSGPATALLLPVGSYAGTIGPGADNDELFAHVYD